MQFAPTFLKPLFNACLLATMFVGLSACVGESTLRQAGAEGVVESTIEVEFFRDGCVGEGGRLCLQVMFDGADRENFFDEIDGFNFEWGYRYTLHIAARTVENPPQDGSSIAWSLLEQLDRQAVSVPGEFSIWVPGIDLLIEKKSAALYTLGDGKTFRCEPTVCDDLDSFSTQQFWALLVFELASNVDDPMILKRIECGDSPTSFIVNCL